MKPPSYTSIAKLVWPLALGMANHAAMQFTDRVFLAYESAASLSAVLPAAMLAAVFICFFQSIVAYAGTFTAQYHGAGDEAGCRRSYWAGVALSGFSLLAFLALVPLGPVVFSWAGHASEIAARENTYYRIVMYGAFGVCGTMAASTYLTGRGHTRRVFWAHVTGNALNVALDPLLIFGWRAVPAMGIAGAAWATVISQALQMVLLHFFIWRAFKANPCVAYAKGLVRLTVQVVRYGLPAGVYQVLNLLSFTLFVFATAAAGETALAVSNAVFTINYFLFAPMEGFAIGAGVLVGQYLGAGDTRNAKCAANRVVALALGYAAIGGVLVFLFRHPILSLFAGGVPPEQAGSFLGLGVTLLLISIAWQLFDAADTVLSGALKGAGDTRFVMAWMFVASFCIWLPVVYLVKCRHPTMPAFWATMVFFVFTIFTGTLLRWRAGAWEKIKLIGREKEDLPA